jgi:peptide-methionine (S)-S-oxide reductase
VITDASNNSKIATFGAGCFWQVEAAFVGVAGVIDTEVGYMGGSFPNPTYEDVCRKDTGHAEVVQITFDSREVSFKKLLEIFWKIHDPTQLERQGHDIGYQYRSVIFFHSEEQKKVAEKSLLAEEASERYDAQIVTAIEPAGIFYRAEDYHQKYFEKIDK